jgi:hypothetical protein
MKSALFIGARAGGVSGASVRLKLLAVLMSHSLSYN